VCEEECGYGGDASPDVYVCVRERGGGGGGGGGGGWGGGGGGGGGEREFVCACVQRGVRLRW